MKRIFSAITTSILPSIGKSYILREPDVNKKYLLALNGVIKVSDFLRYLLLKIKISTKEDITIQTLQKSI